MPAEARDARQALQVLDAAATRAWCRAGVAALRHARDTLDSLNVFPVPDGDAGTNMLLTMEAAAEAVDAAHSDDLGATVAALSQGALLGARGNSGIILSQVLRGLGDVLRQAHAGGAAAPTLADALAHGADAAYAAVARPVEGTMLSVARAAADAAEAARALDLAGVARAAAGAAREAVARTEDQLEALRLAGVVDAGGLGLALLLDALVGVLTGEQPVGVEVDSPRPRAVAMPARPGPAYEVMYLLDAPDAAVARLRDDLSGLGDSLVVVGGDGLWNVHVHVDDAGAAIEAALGAGRPHRIRVTHLAATAGAAGAGPPPRRGARPRGVVAVVAGAGLASLFEQAGAVVVAGGPGQRASRGDLMAGIRGANAPEVVVLPNDGDSLAVAEAAAREARRGGVRVAVVPTRASVQALAAIAVHDPARSFDDDVVAMTAAAGHARHGAVTVAVREAVTTAGICRPGDALGVLEGDFAIVGDDLAEVAWSVVERLVSGGGEMVTLVTGEGAPAGLAESLAGRLRAARPEIDTVVYAGGQPRYPLLVGVE